MLPPGAWGGTERVFAFVGTALNGLQIVDVTDPTAPERVGVYDCRVSQADVFVFEQGPRPAGLHPRRDRPEPPGGL